MSRTFKAMVILAGGLAIGGCSNSMNATDERASGASSEGVVRFDANGNKIYDPSVQNTGTTEYSDGHVSDRREASRWNSSAGSQRWEEGDVYMVREADLPGPVRTTFEHECGGYTMTDTGRMQWNGKPCYCTKYRKDGATYRVISDPEGNVLASNRVD